MNMEWASLVVGLSLSSVHCLAGSPAGSQMADDILRQNPQIKSLASVPKTLRGENVRDCPAGGTPDLSRNRCVIAYLPYTDQVYVFALHPNSRKVWLVYQTGRAQRSSVFLGAFDMNGDRVAQQMAANTAKSGGNLGPPRTRPSMATQPLAINQSTPASGGQTDNQSHFERQWLGKWSSGNKSSLEITPNSIKYRRQVGDEGVYKMVTADCKWSPLQDALRKPDSLPPGTGSGLSSPSRLTRSKEDIVRKFENTKAIMDHPSYANTLRSMGATIQMMKPGRYAVVLLYLNGEVHELIIDGDHIWRHIALDDDGVIELFTSVGIR